MTDFIDAQGFRANVGIVLIRDGGEVFLGSRSDGRGWQFPQGGVQREESPEEALFRELHEEIGLEPEDVEVIATHAGLAALPPAAPVRQAPVATAVHRPEAALVPAAHAG